MGRLEELIQELCPNGVEYVALGILAKISDGYAFKASDLNEDGKYPVFKITNIKKGTVEIDKYFIDEIPDDYKFDDILTGREILIGMSGSTGKTGINLNLKTKCLVNQRIAIVKPDLNKTVEGYLKHILVNNKFEIYCNKKGTGPQKNIGKSVIEEYEVPLPPMEVQSEIVRILDNFTLLTAELTAELTARKEQYNFYKQKMFDDLELEKISVKHITDIAMVKARVGWQRLTTAEYLQTGDYALITGTDFRKDGTIDFNKCVYVTKDRYEMDSNIIVHKNDILITKDGTLGKVAMLTEEPPKPTTLNSGVFRIKITDNNVLPRFMYHYFTSKYFIDFVESVKTGSTIPHLTQQGLVSLDIPIPSVVIQERLIKVLDNFESLCNDLSIGLPAEIDARQQQYEFYRNKLLTFKELE